MATSWKSQQGGDKYELQFETDIAASYKTMEKVAQLLVDGRAAEVLDALIKARLADITIMKK